MQLAVERRLAHGFRVNGEAAWEDVRFAARADRLLRSAVHLDYGDYRETPAHRPPQHDGGPRGVERLALADGDGAVIRPRLDARAYAAAGGQALRGWPAGIAVGDRIAAASIELRLPITSVLSEGRVGLRFFYDTATVYDSSGGRLDQIAGPRHRIDPVEPARNGAARARGVVRTEQRVQLTSGRQPGEPRRPQVAPHPQPLQPDGVVGLV